METIKTCDVGATNSSLPKYDHMFNIHMIVKKSTIIVLID